MLAPDFFKKLGRAFVDRKFQIYLVGGAVRDRLLERSITEWDLTTDATPEETLEILNNLRAKAISRVGIKFGTISAKFAEEPIEITTFRSEDYDPDNRSPKVSYGQSLKEDISRRDFTINAIAYDLVGDQLIDPYDGKGDLEKRLIRAVGSAHSRLSEDPLRILRAIRLACQLGFEIEEKTLEAIKNERLRLKILSMERINQEISKLLLTSHPSRGIEFLVSTGVIEQILPELIPSIDLKFDINEHKDIYRHILAVLDAAPPRLELRWAALLHDIAKPLTRQKIDNQFFFLGHEVVGSKMARAILKRLRYPSVFVDYVSKLVYLHQRLPNYDENWSDGGIRRFVRDAGNTLDDLFDLAKADATGANIKKNQRYQENRDRLYQRIKELEKEAEISKIKSPLSGDELMKLFNRPPGPWIKPIKQHLLSLVLDGKLSESDKIQAQKIAEELIKKSQLEP